MMLERAHIPEWDNLKPYEQHFISQWFENGFNASAAYRAAIYTPYDEKLSASGLAAAASKFLHDPRIQAAIKAITSAYAMSVVESVWRLSDMARGSIEAFTDITYLRDKYGELVLENGEPVEVAVFNPVKLLKSGKAHIVKKIKFGSRQTIVELHDPIVAMRTLLELQHLIGSGVDKKPKEESEEGITIEDWKKETERRRAEAETTLALFKDLNPGDEPEQDDAKDTEEE